MYVCMYVCMYVYIYMYVYMYVCMYVYMYVCNALTVENLDLGRFFWCASLEYQSISQSVTDISLVGATSHEGVNGRRQWMAV